MTRKRLVQLLIQQARSSGFLFRRWFIATAGIPWSGADHALEWLCRAERANLLLFSHDFASHFWRDGEQVTYLVPAQEFVRVTARGGTQQVRRKAHLRRSSRKDVWRYHLREMAAHTQPLRYIRRYLIVDEALQPVLEGSAPSTPDDFDE